MARRGVTIFTSGNDLAVPLLGAPARLSLRRDDISKKEKIQSGQGLAAQAKSSLEVRPHDFCQKKADTEITGIPLNM